MTGVLPSRTSSPTTRGGFGRRGRRGALAVVVMTAVAAWALVACTGSPTPPSPPFTPAGTATPAAGARATPGPSAAVRSLGAVPIPPRTVPQPTPKAAAGHPALSAAGGPIAVSFGDEGSALVTVLGPEPASTVARGSVRGAAPGKRTRAYLTLVVRQVKGRATIRADELTSRDETGRPVRLTAEGAKVITTHTGSMSKLRVEGTYDSGAAQVTWRHQGQVLAVWTFTVELD